jgi:NADH-quinone oxidoreductase subunit M
MYDVFPLLSICIITPLLGAIALGAIRDREMIERNAKSVALVTSLFVLFCTLVILGGFDANDRTFQFEEYISWLPQFGIDYHVGIDSISLSMILLSAVLVPICILASWHSITENVRLYMALFLVLESFLMGTFASLNLVQFYVFFEGVLIPMYFLIGIWGGSNRVYAAYKFFLYTLLGSVLMLVGAITIYYHTATFDVVQIGEHTFPYQLQLWLWLAFFASFSVKIPMWPLHTWLPDAHVEAPTAASVILAGVLLKMGGYGFLRFSLPWFPEASLFFAPYVFALSIIAVIYASLIALVQEDMKKLVAYSSIAHMGYVTAGLFSMEVTAVSGAVLQMISHGLISGALFLSVGVLYNRMHTRQLSDFGGIVNHMPIFAVTTMAFLLGSVGFPLTSGFIAELTVLMGVFKHHPFVAAGLAIGVVLGAVYMLKMYARVFYGAVKNKVVYTLKDLSSLEIGLFIPLIGLILWMGCYTTPFVDPLEKTITPLIEKINHIQQGERPHASHHIVP